MYFYFSSFTEDEIAQIQNITFHDVLVAATKTMDGALQKDVFVWKTSELVSFSVFLNPY